MFKNFFRKSCRTWDNVEKYNRAGETTDDNIMRRLRFARLITKATHSEYVILVAIIVLRTGLNVMYIAFLVMSKVSLSTFWLFKRT
jgi:hypothetical protein